MTDRAQMLEGDWLETPTNPLEEPSRFKVGQHLTTNEEINNALVAGHNVSVKNNVYTCVFGVYRYREGKYYYKLTNSQYWRRDCATVPYQVWNTRDYTWEVHS